MIKIESINNKTVKLVNSLKIKKYREREGLFIAEGQRNVCDGAKKVTPVMIFVSEDYKGKCDFPCESYMVSNGIFEKLSDTKSPQGILGVFKKQTVTADEIKGGNVLALNGISDPGNVGTLLRTAEASGFINIIADDGCADIYNPKTVRAAMSAVFGLNIIRTDNLKDDIIKLKKRNYTVYSADIKGENMFETVLKTPSVIIAGSEAFGISPEILEISDVTVRIPMNSGTESLNAAVAGSVFMYETARQQYMAEKLH